MICRIKGAHFVDSIFSLEKFDQYILPEVAFIGRSNVGKSSLINALTNQKHLARASTTPGRTASFNLFEVLFEQEFVPEVGEEAVIYDNPVHFVDLPGYGFARRSKTMRAGFAEMIDDYLGGRPLLKLCLLLVDSRRDLEEEERAVAHAMRREGLSVVLTKADQISRSDLELKSRTVAKELKIHREHVLSASLVGKHRRPVQDIVEAIGRSITIE